MTQAFALVGRISGSTARRWSAVGCLAWSTMLLSGCDKVAEITGTVTNSQPPVAQPGTPGAPGANGAPGAAPNAAPAAMNPKEVIARFKSFEKAQINDANLSELASLPEGLDEFVAFDFEGTQVTNRSLSKLASFKQLTSLKMAKSSVKMDDAVVTSLATLPNLETLAIGDQSLGDSAADALAGLAKLKHLHFYTCQFSPSALKKMFEAMPALETVDMPGVANLNDSVAPAVGALKQLKVLNIPRCTMTDAGVALLTDCVLLERLNLEETQVQGDGLLKMVGAADGLKNLKWISLAKTPLGAKAAQALGKLDGLEELYLNDLRTPADDKGMSFLTSLSKLRVLDIGANKALSNKVLGHVAKLRSLEDLRIRQIASIDDKGLVLLKGLADLKVIEARGCYITEAGIDTLRKSNPDLIVRRE